jgi:ferredoxin
MAGLNFIQKSNLFSFSATHCLRNDYLYNDCSHCIDICPSNAFHLVRNKLTLFENECTECAGCIGGCPSEALTIENFDPNAYIQDFHIRDDEEKIISCKKETPCLAVFDSHHLITMALDSNENITCDIAHCEGCTLNIENKLETRIRDNITLTNTFLNEVGLTKIVQTNEALPQEENNKRALFRKAFNVAKESVIVDEEAPQEVIAPTLQNRLNIATTLPLKVKLLSEALQRNITNFTTTKFESKHPIFINKTISFESCTNCGDCTQFCPTGALFSTDDKLGIIFTSTKCIGCAICDDICKTDAITTKESYDLVDIAYSRSHELVRYEMVMCHECRCPYPYRGGDPICDRCHTFKTSMPDMMTLARDM